MAEEKKAKQKRPTAEKRLIQAEKKRQINKAFKSKMRTTVRRFHESVSAGDRTQVDAALSECYGMLDRAVKRGILKLNKAGRDKSRLAAKAAKVA